MSGPNTIFAITVDDGETISCDLQVNGVIYHALTVAAAARVARQLMEFVSLSLQKANEIGKRAAIGDHS